jgi:hypothetical protein
MIGLRHELLVELLARAEELTDEIVRARESLYREGGDVATATCVDYAEETSRYIDAGIRLAEVRADLVD